MGRGKGKKMGKGKGKEKGKGREKGEGEGEGKEKVEERQLKKCRTHGRTDTKVILYSVQCYWTDNGCV